MSDITYDILNYGGSADDYLIVQQYSGDVSDLKQEVIRVLAENPTHGLDAGDWITVADGEIVESGEFHPFQIEAGPECTVELDGSTYGSLYLLEYSGAPADLPAKLDGMVDPDEMDGGDWIVVTDHNVETGVTAHPSCIEIRRD